MLYTNLKHIESASDLNQIISGNDQVVVICGRMDPVSVSVYRLAGELEKNYPQVQFYDMEYDDPESENLRKLPGLLDFEGLPFSVYFRNGKLERVSVGIFSINQMENLFIEEKINN